MSRLPKFGSGLPQPGSYSSPNNSSPSTPGHMRKGSNQQRTPGSAFTTPTKNYAPPPIDTGDLATSPPVTTSPLSKYTAQSGQAAQVALHQRRLTNENLHQVMNGTAPPMNGRGRGRGQMSPPAQPQQLQQSISTPPRGFGRASGYGARSQSMDPGGRMGFSPAKPMNGMPPPQQQQQQPTFMNAPNPAPGARRVSTGRPSQTSMGTLHPGERVKVDSMNLEGTLKFLGPIAVKPGLWAGIELDQVGAGKNDGSVGGVSYFSCPPKTGIFVLASKVSKPDGMGENVFRDEPIAESPMQMDKPPMPVATPRNGLRRPALPSDATQAPAGKPLQFQPTSRASKFTGMTAQQYKRASLMGQVPGLPMPQQEIPPPPQQQQYMSGSPPGSRGHAHRLSMTRGMPPMQMGAPPPMNTLGGMGTRRVSLIDPDEVAKLRVRLEVVEAENRLLKVRDQQQQAQLAASEMLERGVVVEAQAAIESSGELAAWRERADILEKEHRRLEAEKNALERELHDIKSRRISMAGTLSGLGDEEENMLRLTELLQEREQRIRDLEEELMVTRRAITDGDATELLQRVKDLEDALAESDQALMAKEDLERELRQQVENAALSVGSNSRSGRASADPTRELEKVRKRIKELEDHLETKSIEMGQLSARLDRVYTESEKDKTVLQETVNQLRQAGQETISIYEEKLQNLREEQFMELHAMQGDSGDQQVDVEMLHALKLEQRDLTDRIHMLESEKERLIRAGQETIEVYELRVRQLKDELERIRSEEHGHGGMDDSTRLQLEAAKEEVLAIKEAAARNELERAHLEKELDALRDESQRLAADAAEALELGEKASQQVETYKQENQRLLQQLKEAGERHTKTTQMADHERKQSQGNMEEVVQKQMEIDDLRAQIEALSIDRTELEIKVQELETAELNRSVKEVEDMVVLQGHQAEASKMERELLELRGELGKVQQEVAMLRQERDDLAARLQAALSGSGGGGADESALRTELQHVQDAYEQVKAENAELTEAQDQLVKAHQAVENECFKLMDELERLHSEQLNLPSMDMSNVMEGGDEALVRQLTEKQRQLDQQSQTFRDEIRRLQQRNAELEREKMVEVEAREKDIADLESLVESKIFREADLEEQLEQQLNKVRELERRAKTQGGDPEARPTANGKVHTRRDSSERLFCEICEIEGHDIMSCPAVMGGGGAKTVVSGSARAAMGTTVKATTVAADDYQDADDDEDFDRPYCENCEEFGAHWTEDCPNGDETF